MNIGFWSCIILVIPFVIIGVLFAIFKEKEIPYLLVYNKEDILSEEQKNILSTEQEGQANHICVSALEKTHINELKEKLARLVKTDSQKLQLVGDLVHPADLVVLVIPIDKAAPKGRLILPQQQVHQGGSDRKWQPLPRSSSRLPKQVPHNHSVHSPLRF